MRTLIAGLFFTVLGFSQAPMGGIPSGVFSSTTFVAGLPVTNATFPRVLVTAAASGDVDIYTAPAGKRVLVTNCGGYNNNGSVSVTWFPEIKSGGSYYRLANSATTGNGSNSTAAVVGIVLEAGESISVNSSAAGMNLTCGAVQFDNTSPLRTYKVLGPATSNAVVLYTVPSGKTASVLAAPGFSFNGASVMTYAAGATGTNVQTCIFLNGGSTTCSAANTTAQNTGVTASTRSSSLTTGAIALNSGDGISLNVATGDAAQIGWINVLEL